MHLIKGSAVALVALACVGALAQAAHVDDPGLAIGTGNAARIDGVPAPSLAPQETGALHGRAPEATAQYASKEGTFVLWYDASEWQVEQERPNSVTFTQETEDGTRLPVTIDTSEDAATVDAVKTELIAAVREKNPKVELVTDTRRTVNGAHAAFVELKDASVIYDFYITARGHHVVAMTAVWDKRLEEAGERVMELFDGLTLQ